MGKGKTGGAEPGVTEPLQEPAVSESDAPAFDDELAPEPAVIVEVSSPNYHKVVMGVLRGLDRGLSVALRSDRCTESELADVAETIVPAMEVQSPRLGPLFWAVVAGIGFAGFVLGKIVSSRPLPRSATNGDAQDPSPSPNTGVRYGQPTSLR